MFCTNCGAQIRDNCNFCPKCGSKVTPFTAAPVQAEPFQAEPVQTAPVEAPAAAPVTAACPGGGIPVPRRNITYRYKCPACGEVQDTRIGASCRKCSAPVRIDFDHYGFIQIYRMGHFSGAAAGQGIYLNTVPMGHVANQGSVVLALEPGSYNVHLAIAMCRKCEDRVIDVKPGEISYFKSQMHMGAWSNHISINPANASDMPEINS